MLAPIDEIRLNFNPAALNSLNVIIGLIMFGVAMDITKQDLTKVLKKPVAPLIGLICQFVILPIATLILIKIVNPAPSIGLGMILLSTCPGGSLSNFLTHLSEGNVSLSVSMSSISTLAAIFMTPLNFALYSSFYEPAGELLKTIYLDPVVIIQNIMFILIIPSILGFIISQKYPKLKKRIEKPMKNASMIIFIGFVLGALYNNLEHFKNYVGLAFFIVLTANAMALSIGYWIPKILKLSERDARACSFEVGIQNAGFCLVLVFSFFDGLGGMALITAWWGIWHIISGLTLATYWKKKRWKLNERKQTYASTI